jgi:hypothetical protein
VTLGQESDGVGAHVVATVLVLVTGIAQPDDE